ncbi:MAG TPA: hypothetical protein PKX92_01745 [Edaphocola sp.]|nr:hypothetical protein [Edaphocola sp.]
MEYYLLFCNKGDQLINNLHIALNKRGINSIIITDIDLALAKKWIHKCNSDGVFQTEIYFNNGFVLRPEEVKGIMNRIKFIRLPQFQHSKDKTYAEMEILALFISFLESMKSKLLFPFRVENFVAKGNDNFNYFVWASQVGLSILDFMFSSSPKWQHRNDWPRSPIFIDDINNLGNLIATPIIMEEPVIFRESFKMTQIVTLYKGVATTNKIVELNFHSEYLKFYEVSSEGIIQLFWGKTKFGWKLFDFNSFPKILNENDIQKLIDSSFL